MAAEQFLYLTTTGRKTGLPREIEIWYAELDGRYYLISELRERAQWVRNLLAQPAVRIRVGEVDVPGRGRVVDPTAEPRLARAVCALFDEKYGWSDGLIVELTPAPPGRSADAPQRPGP